MAHTDNLHSTLVAWLKVVLPLIALGLLSTLFLVARTIDPDGAIPYAEADIEDLVREPRLTEATWAGMTEDGSALTISADEAIPGANDQTGSVAKALTAKMETPDGALFELRSDQGDIDAAGNLFTMTGDVVVTTSSGYRIETDALAARLDRTKMSSETAIKATGPLGTLEAGSMTMTLASDAVNRDLNATDAAEGYVLVFNGGVRLLYQPPSTPTPSREP